MEEEKENNGKNDIKSTKILEDKKENNDKNDNNNDMITKLGKFHDYFENKFNAENKSINVNKIKEDNNFNHIYFKYLENNDIIFQNKDNNNENLKLLFKELNNDLDKGNNIILPFLDVLNNLVKAYIESDLDDFIKEESITPFETPGQIPGVKEVIKGETKSETSRNNTKSLETVETFYLEVINKLKYNCFVNKEVLIPIYEYYSNLYDIVKEIKEDDKLIKKFYKMKNLFKIFYEKGNNKNESSICSLGGNFKIVFNKELKLSEGYQINIIVNFLTYYFEDIIKNSCMIKIKEIEEKYECLLNNIDSKLKSVNFTINSNIIYIEINTEKRDFKIMENIKLEEITEISIFEKFVGQISSIDVTIIKNSNKIEYNFHPKSIRNENNIYYYKKSNKGDNLKDIQNLIPKIIVSNPNLVKINYLNYNDKKFDIIDYFGGIIQFLPFYHIFNTLIDKNLNKINEDVNQIKEESLFNESYSRIENETSKKKIDFKINDYISDFASFLIKIIQQKLFLANNKIKLFKKYSIFIYYIILNIKTTLEIDNVFDEKKKENNKKINLYSYIDLLIMIYYNLKNTYSYDAKIELKDLITNNEKKIENYLELFEWPKQTFNQLYRYYMKKLFIFNNFWSKKKLFFKKKNEITNEKLKEIKYKQINYYTKNFQLPYFYPILEITQYYPKFSKLKEGIFLGEDKDMLTYTFKFEGNQEYKKILLSLIPSEKKYNYLICCMIKNTHHVTGKLFLDKKNSKKFQLIFKKEKMENKTCNKINIKKDKNKKGNPIKDSLCYGSVFEIKKEYSKVIIIKSQDILFLLFRVYFHRISAIEIFTINNKSYYFNFFEQYELNNLKKNFILNEIKSNPYFKEIKLKKEKIILGYYNTIYESYLFPLFNDDINIWDKKIHYLSNYDIISFINIFSNRSFRDVYQYPVFPTLYNWINLKREMDQPIGLQDIIDESKNRKKIMIESYISKEEDEDFEEKCLFNIHYSNPAFTFNYLLRVLPYSFLAVEFQGDDFDNSNRLFYSVEKSLKSSLTLKSDLREMIPELYYMIEIFYNKNNILFDNLYDGSNINYVEIISKEEDKSQNEQEKKQNMAKFLTYMRKCLEEENNLNKWIDIIFGTKQNKSIIEKKEIQNYEKSSETLFKNEPKLYNDSLIMDLADFGLLPFQLFNKDFPSKDIKNKTKINEIKKLNFELFTQDHINGVKSPLDCFICKGSTLINNNYINIIEKEQINIFDYFEFPHKYIHMLDINNLNKFIFDNSFGHIDIDESKKFSSKVAGLINYYFIGDIFGSIFVYSLLKEKKNKKDEDKEEEEDDEEIIEEFGSFEVETSDKSYTILGKKNNSNTFYNGKQNKINKLPISKNRKIVFKFELKLIKKLYDHTKEIRYIDFNPRLNILLSYSIDNYINIYIFPKLKLINVIDTCSFKEKDDSNYFDEVVPISYPFPMIVCHNKEFIYLLTINGELIKNEKLEEKHTISYYIDKNLGLSEDIVEISDSKGKHFFNIIQK